MTPMLTSTSYAPLIEVPACPRKINSSTEDELRK